MTTPLIAQLRALLLEMKQRSLDRHKAYSECEEGFAKRREILEATGIENRQHLDDNFAAQQAAVRDELEQSLADINGTHDAEHERLTEEFGTMRAGIEERHAGQMGRATAQFKEAQWTILTLHESDKTAARNQVLRAQQALKDSRAELKDMYLKTRRLIRSWHFAAHLNVSLNYQPRLTPTDPWKNLEQRRDIIVDCRDRLSELTLPRLLNGRFLLWATLLTWLVLAVPAFFVASWFTTSVWLLAVTLVTVAANKLARYWMTRTARLRIALLWQGLAQAFIDAKPLRSQCLTLARNAYKSHREQSRAKHRKSLKVVVEKYRSRRKVLKTRIRQQLPEIAEQYEQAILEIVQQRDHDLRAAQEQHDASQQQLQAQYEEDVKAGDARQARLCAENDARHEREWQKLLAAWQETCRQCDAMLETIGQVFRHDFPPWEALAEHWQPPAQLPDGLPIGTLEVSPDLIPYSEPEDPRLGPLSLVGAAIPALLPFPERASVMFKAVEHGRDAGIKALEALLLRSWTCLPPGKLRCTIIDPVGRGENFAAFMHLADQDESLINSRIWTEMSHIDQRLADMTTHMETVLQKFLRNRYETLAEYNAQAGEVAEPFRLLVVAHFPVNFSTDAARRLISLASAGARCGIYTLVMVDAKQPMPHGVELADLEAASINLIWREGKFRWRDADFGDYPLTLAVPPAPEVCTHILAEVGEKAKNANRVEVPFQSIAPPEGELWSADSRAGISVPLGRAGATAFQLLTLGKGTSQHVLIAGKTGSGKSTLLHVLITQLALHYSPAEVELYLIDFKKGVEFKTYASHHLPHARVVAVESEREFGLSVLQRLDAELGVRGELFRQAGVNDLPSYRKASEEGRLQNADCGLQIENTNHPQSAIGNRQSAILPRILLIVDEFQEFFVEDDKIAHETALLMDRLVRQGRAFGIHVILGSQTLGGAYSLARSTIDQMAVRIALQCSEADAHLILSKENSEARLLSRPGEAIYNAANGLLEGNNLFQIVWITDQLRDDYLAKLGAMASARGAQTPMIVFEGTAPSDLAKNPWFAKDVAPGVRSTSPRGLHCWLGEAVAIKDPTAAVFRRQSGANLLIVGQDGDTAFSLMVASCAGLQIEDCRLKIEEKRVQSAISNLQSAILFVAAATLNEEYDNFLKDLPGVLPMRLVPQRELPELLANLSEELQRRQKDNAEGEPIFVFLYGLQRMRDLRRGDDDFGYSRREEKPSPSKLFQTLLRDGPPLGIFTIVWCDTMTNLQRCVDRQGMREFEMRVLFPMNAADSSNLMDSPAASKLGPHRALFYSEDQGKTEKFRPYGLPAMAWLRELFGHTRPSMGETVVADGVERPSSKASDDE